VEIFRGYRHGAKGACRPDRHRRFTADAARAHFILARVDLMTGHPDEAIDDFQKTLATSKEQRLLAWVAYLSWPHAGP